MLKIRPGKLHLWFSIRARMPFASQLQADLARVSRGVAPTWGEVKHTSCTQLYPVCGHYVCCLAGLNKKLRAKVSIRNWPACIFLYGYSQIPVHTVRCLNYAVSWVQNYIFVPVSGCRNCLRVHYSVWISLICCVRIDPLLLLWYLHKCLRYFIEVHKMLAASLGYAPARTISCFFRAKFVVGE